MISSGFDASVKLQQLFWFGLIGILAILLGYLLASDFVLMGLGLSLEAVDLRFGGHLYLRSDRSFLSGPALRLGILCASRLDRRGHHAVHAPI